MSNVPSNSNTNTRMYTNNNHNVIPETHENDDAYAICVMTLYIINTAIIYALVYTYSPYDIRESALASLWMIIICDLFLFKMFYEIYIVETLHRRSLGKKIAIIYWLHYYVAFIPYYFGYWGIGLSITLLGVFLWLGAAIYYAIRSCFGFGNCKYVEEQPDNDV